MSKEAMKKALEAMRSYQGDRLESGGEINLEEEIKALEEALNQEQAEPVAWRVKVDVKLSDGKVSTTYQLRNTKLSEFDEPLYTTPQPSQKPWVGLTDDERQGLWYRFGYMELMREIEAKLKEKNT